MYFTYFHSLYEKTYFCFLLLRKKEKYCWYMSSCLSELIHLLFGVIYSVDRHKHMHSQIPVEIYVHMFVLRETEIWKQIYCFTYNLMRLVSFKLFPSAFDIPFPAFFQFQNVFRNLFWRILFRSCFSLSSIIWN